jgi:hypothetical protein
MHAPPGLGPRTMTAGAHARDASAADSPFHALRGPGAAGSARPPRRQGTPYSCIRRVARRRYHDTFRAASAARL